MTENDRNRFWSKIIPEPYSGCWLWTGGCFGNGYAAFAIKRKNYAAHVISFIISGGKITEEKPCVLHSCNTRACVNPTHLRAGSMQDNVDDAMRAGNHGLALTAFPRKRAKGEQHGMAILTESKVKAIRSEYVPYYNSREKLAKKYGVSPATIQQILSRKTWKNVR